MSTNGFVLGLFAAGLNMAVNLMLRVGIEAAGGVTFANPGADGADAREALQAILFCSWIRYQRSGQPLSVLGVRNRTFEP